MRTMIAEPYRLAPATHEIRAGVASWDDGSETAKSIKFTWFNAANGHASRGGEVPVEALPQMLEFAIKHGFLKLG